MYSQSDIEEAVAGGALTAEQAASLRGFVATRNGVPTADEEHFRLVVGFNDIFAFVACIFGLIALGWLGSLIPLEARRMGMLPFQAPFAALFVAAAAWGLAEIFTRRRHLALTSILLTAAFGWGIALFLALLLLSVAGTRDQIGAALFLALSMGAGAGAALLHWRRFRVPVAIATAAGFAILAFLVLFGVLMIGSRDSGTIVAVLTLAGGVGAFFYAMRWDGQDLARHTEKSDVAFWLHWLAAGLVVNALTQLFGLNSIDSILGALGVLVVYVLFALVALAVNRKAVLVVGLTPLVLAIRSLVSEGSYRSRPRLDPYANPYGYNVPAVPGPYPTNPYGFSPPTPRAGPEGAMITMLIIAAILLLLAIYWAPVRQRLVALLPEGLRRRLPPTDTASVVGQTFE